MVNLCTFSGNLTKKPPESKTFSSGGREVTYTEVTFGTNCGKGTEGLFITAKFHRDREAEAALNLNPSEKLVVTGTLSWRPKDGGGFWFDIKDARFAPGFWPQTPSEDTISPTKRRSAVVDDMDDL